jgi:hypothetical protein
MSASTAGDASLIIRRSLEREMGLLEMKKRLTDEEITRLERKYGIGSAEFMTRFEAGDLGDSQDCFEWWGLIRGRNAIENEMEKIRVVLSA